MKFVSSTIFVLMWSASLASANECSYAVDAYNNATSEISSNLRRYVSCLDGSQGNDDCSSEFRRLKNAQSDFETAVSNYRSYDCR